LVPAAQAEHRDLWQVLLGAIAMFEDHLLILSLQKEEMAQHQEALAAQGAQQEAV
jgi:hypothetical protein